jgi:hypothetical protein
VQGRLERLPEVLVLLRGEDVRLVDDRATDRVPNWSDPSAETTRIEPVPSG